MLFCGLQNLLHARDEGREGGDDDPSLRPVENFFESVIDYALRSRPTRTFGIGGVGKQRQHALAGELRQLAVISGTPIDRRVV